jgi:hypothetical protein
MNFSLASFGKKSLQSGKISSHGASRQSSADHLFCCTGRAVLIRFPFHCAGCLFEAAFNNENLETKSLNN